MWQRHVFELERARNPPAEALRRMLERYLTLSEADAPVHTWPDAP